MDDETYTCAGCAGQVSVVEAIWLPVGDREKARPYCCSMCCNKNAESSRIADLELRLAAMTKDRNDQAEAVAFIGGAVRTTRAHVWTETPGVEIQVFADPDVPHSLRLVVRDVHAKEDLASVRVEAFRLDLLCGPIVRLLLEHRLAMAAAKESAQ